MNDFIDLLLKDFLGDNTQTEPSESPICLGLDISFVLFVPTI